MLEWCFVAGHFLKNIIVAPSGTIMFAPIKQREEISSVALLLFLYRVSQLPYLPVMISEKLTSSELTVQGKSLIDADVDCVFADGFFAI